MEQRKSLDFAQVAMAELEIGRRKLSRVEQLYAERTVLAGEIANIARLNRAAAEEPQVLRSKAIRFASGPVAGFEREVYVVAETSHVNDEWESERYSTAALRFYLRLEGVANYGSLEHQLETIDGEPIRGMLIAEEALPVYYHPLKELDNKEADDDMMQIADVRQSLQVLDELYSFH